MGVAMPRVLSRRGLPANVAVLLVVAGVLASTLVFTQTVRGALGPGQASLTLIVDATPNSQQDFAFNFTGAGAPGTATLDDDPGNATFPNQVSVVFDSEDLPGIKMLSLPKVAGWMLDEIVCDGDPDVNIDLPDPEAFIDLDPGEEVVCTFFPKSETTITIQQSVSPTDHPQDFHFDLSGPNSFDFDLDGDTSDATLPIERTYYADPFEIEPITIAQG